MPNQINKKRVRAVDKMMSSEALEPKEMQETFTRMDKSVSSDFLEGETRIETAAKKAREQAMETFVLETLTTIAAIEEAETAKKEAQEVLRKSRELYNKNKDLIQRTTRGESEKLDPAVILKNQRDLVRAKRSLPQSDLTPASVSAPEQNPPRKKVRFITSIKESSNADGIIIFSTSEQARKSALEEALKKRESSRGAQDDSLATHAPSKAPSPPLEQRNAGGKPEVHSTSTVIANARKSLTCSQSTRAAAAAIVKARKDQAPRHPKTMQDSGSTKKRVRGENCDPNTVRGVVKPRWR